MTLRSRLEVAEHLSTMCRLELRSSCRAAGRPWLSAQVLTRKAAVEVLVSILLAQGTPTIDTAWILAVCNGALILSLVVDRHCIAAHAPFRHLQVPSGRMCVKSLGGDVQNIILC